MKVLILEDDGQEDKRMPHFRERIKELEEISKSKIDIVHVETAKDCIAELERVPHEKERFDIIFLDHDLGGQVFVDTNREDTGSEVARWISKNPEKIYGAFVITHTFNTVGAKNITNLLPNAVYIPGIWLKDQFHKIVKIV